MCGDPFCPYSTLIPNFYNRNFAGSMSVEEVLHWDDAIGGKVCFEELWAVLYFGQEYCISLMNFCLDCSSWHFPIHIVLVNPSLSSSPLSASITLSLEALNRSTLFNKSFPDLSYVTDCIIVLTKFVIYKFNDTLPKYYRILSREGGETNFV